MNRPGRILVVDDDDEWLRFLDKYLTAEGYRVDSAHSSAEAIACASKSLYHVAVLDIRLEEGDPQNTEGMALLKYLADRGINRFTNIAMLSAHGDDRLIPEAFVKFGAVHFYSKRNFDILEFVTFLKEILSRSNKRRPINLGLRIFWQGVAQPDLLVRGVEIGGTAIGSAGSLSVDHAMDELDDLLCRLYSDARELVVMPLAPGRSGSGILKVLAVYEEGNVARAEVVKFGDVEQIACESSNYGKYVGRFVGAGRTTSLRAKARTLHLGGICYSLLGTKVEDVKDFASFYGQNSVARVTEAIERLFDDTCAHWYAGRGQIGAVNLSYEYTRALGFTREKVENAIASLAPSVESGPQLRFKGLDVSRTLVDPLRALAHPDFVALTYRCTTHGDFNAHNILLDRAGDAWLIDFQRTGSSHILRDIAQLDSVVRFQLLPEEMSLPERLALEAALDEAGQSGQTGDAASTIAAVNGHVAKAFETVLKLRELANELISVNPIADMSEYYVALYYHAINFVRFSWAPSIQREHALLCASLLVDRL
jgi:DNA-binding response OmpR family regulator